jgi:hypothetical protein
MTSSQVGIHGAKFDFFSNHLLIRVLDYWRRHGPSADSGAAHVLAVLPMRRWQAFASTLCAHRRDCPKVMFDQIAE